MKGEQRKQDDCAWPAGLRLVCRTAPGLYERIGDQQNGGGKYESMRVSVRAH